MTSLNIEVDDVTSTTTLLGNPLTLDSTTSPTVVNFSDFPSGLTIGDQYTFEVIATDPSDDSISASYSITVTIVEPCTLATFRPGTVQHLVPPEWAAFPYYDGNEYI